MSRREIDGVAGREPGGGKRDHSAPGNTSGHRAGPELMAGAEVMSGQCRGPLGRDLGCAGVSASGESGHHSSRHAGPSSDLASEHLLGFGLEPFQPEGSLIPAAALSGVRWRSQVSNLGL